MSVWKSSGRLGAVVTGVAMHACGGMPAQGPPPSPADPGHAELEALFLARADSATMRFSPADVAFMTGMIRHHGQAIEMATLSPSRGASPSILTLSGRVINAQRDEIALMRSWLADRGQPVPPPDGSIAGGGLPGGVQSMHAPGMLTPEQMAGLRGTTGPSFDRRFLRSMIQHHQGAVTMVDELFATDGAALDETVFRLASAIRVDQITEISRMERMLEELPAPPRRP